MNLLDQELVRKYFGCVEQDGCKAAHHNPDLCAAYMATRILRAMQEPIGKGEKYLFWHDNFVELRISDGTDLTWSSHSHPWCFRLPEAWQGGRECSDYRLQCRSCKKDVTATHECRGSSDCHHFDKPDAVEEKCFCGWEFRGKGRGPHTKECRELVELARK